MRRHVRPTAAALLLLAMSTGGSGVTAQSAGDPSVDFVVTPSRLEIQAQPGDSFQVPISVFNRAGEMLVLDAYIEDIEIPRNELIQPDDLAFTASRWLSFGAEHMFVVGGGNGDIMINVDVPEATPSGGYHAFGFLQSPAQEGPTGIQPSGRIGVTLLLEVAPEDAEIDRSAILIRKH